MKQKIEVQRHAVKSRTFIGEGKTEAECLAHAGGQASDFDFGQLSEGEVQYTMDVIETLPDPEDTIIVLLRQDGIKPEHAQNQEECVWFYASYAEVFDDQDLIEYLTPDREDHCHMFMDGRYVYFYPVGRASYLPAHLRLTKHRPA